MLQTAQIRMISSLLCTFYHNRFQALAASTTGLALNLKNQKLPPRGLFPLLFPFIEHFLFFSERY